LAGVGAATARSWGGAVTLLTMNVVGRLAESIYQERDWGRLPILGDALEEVGCSIPAVLQHCRERHEHVRGCWVVDLALQRGTA
jgi:hypothetical protein